MKSNQKNTLDLELRVRDSDPEERTVPTMLCKDGAAERN